MIKNINRIISNLLIFFIIFGWVNALHADCSEDEIKALFTQEVVEMKRKGFFDFKEHTLPPDQNKESRYYFIAKKNSLGGVQVYGGVLVADIRICEGLKELNLERLKPLFVSDFKKVWINTEEDCSENRVKNIIYYELKPYLENGFHSYYGSLMKSWGYYEFVYTAINTNPDRTYSVNYLSRIEIPKNNCSIKEHLMVPFYPQSL